MLIRKSKQINLIPQDQFETSSLGRVVKWMLSTTGPEFFGNGPKNTSIEVAVESELQEAILSTDASEKWKNNSGIFRTLTRTFIVQAAEGPAFESTPSATPNVVWDKSNVN